jgi:hypothetical protein
MSNTVAASLDVFQTLRAGIPMPALPEDHNELQVLAHEYARACAEDDLLATFLGILTDAQEGEYRHIRVNMRGVGGNSMDIMGAVKKGLKSGGLPHIAVQIFLWKSMRGDYENVLRTAATWVTIVDEPINRTRTAVEAFDTYL